MAKDRFKTILLDFKKFIESKDLLFKEQDFKDDLVYIKLMIKAEIARNLWGSPEYYQIRISGDSQVKQALNYIERASRLTGFKVD
ncbi:hypothetical protein B6I21_01475 [candidate division KSB1 bacterium 4572_119]|nr:MAG: hypothetical protein B6I21_01475 [candidate division KSB1 bacterium 4572_119]